MAYTVPREATWLEDLPSNIYEDKNFQKIINFYVVHSIVEGVSSRGKSIITEYHWVDPWKSSSPIIKQLAGLSSNPSLLYPAQVLEHKKVGATETTIEEALIDADFIDFPKYEEEKACFHLGKRATIPALFAHIRNGFAHCRFNIMESDDNRVYCFEDVLDLKKDPVQVTARIVLFESTLLKWIEYIENRGASFIGSSLEEENVEEIAEQHEKSKED